MNAPWNASADQFIEYALLQRCFTKPHHTWTEEEAGASAVVLANQRAARCCVRPRSGCQRVRLKQCAGLLLEWHL